MSKTIFFLLSLFFCNYTITATQKFEVVRDIHVPCEYGIINQVGRFTGGKISMEYNAILNKGKPNERYMHANLNFATKIILSTITVPTDQRMAPGGTTLFDDSVSIDSSYFNFLKRIFKEQTTEAQIASSGMLEDISFLFNEEQDEAY